jgi:hypothetical protein
MSVGSTAKPSLQPASKTGASLCTSLETPAYCCRGVSLGLNGRNLAHHDFKLGDKRKLRLENRAADASAASNLLQC